MNQMEIFKNPEFGSIRVIEENGKYLFSGTMWLLRWGTVIPAMQLSAIVGMRETRRTSPTKPRPQNQYDFYPRRRFVPPDRSQQIAIGRAV